MTSESPRRRELLAALDRMFFAKLARLKEEPDAVLEYLVREEVLKKEDVKCPTRHN